SQFVLFIDSRLQRQFVTQIDRVVSRRGKVIEVENEDFEQQRHGTHRKRTLEDMKNRASMRKHEVSIDTPYVIPGA
ncbi:MAG: hypothetical protein RR692_04155, partial [Raoultibacter sp.]